MPLVETLILTVAPAISKLVLKFWAGDEKLAAEGGNAAIDLLAKLIPDLRARKEAGRQLDAIGERAAASLQFTFDTEGKSLLTDDQDAVAILVAEALHRTDLLDCRGLASSFLGGLFRKPVSRLLTWPTSCQILESAPSASSCAEIAC
jgi:hypothetical protein